MSPSQNQSVSPVLKVIYFALMVSIGIYYGVVQFLKTNWTTEPQVNEELLMICSVVGFAVCFLGMIVNRILFVMSLLWC